jgi:dienelactone hydrolase
MRRYHSLCVALLLVLAMSLSGVASATDSFSDSYRAGSRCGTNYSISGQEPHVGGSYPVFVYVVGTWESHTNASAQAAVRNMAERGYVAATINYPNSSFGGCSAIAGKADCAFNPKRAASAINKLCQRDKADCSKGIVVAGFSQGSIMAILAKNYDSRVEAAYALGAGVQYDGYDLRSCVADGNRTLASSRLRAVNGEVDGFMGGNASSVRAQLEELTGMTCGGSAYDCSGTGGSGWRMVRHSEVEDREAEHCYMRVGGCGLNQNRLDNYWLYGTGNWSLEPNLDWLTGFTR